MTRSPLPSGSSSSTKKFGVFEFTEQDVNVEKVSRRMIGKFISPRKSRSSPITKYDFLQAFANDSKPISKPHTADLINLDDDQEEENDEDNCSPEEISNKQLEIDDDDDDDGVAIDNQVKCVNVGSVDTPPQHFADADIPGCNETVERDFELKNQSLDMLSDDDDSSQMSLFSNSALTPPEAGDYFEDDQPMEHGSSAFKINGIKKVVDVSPDFIQFEDLYSTSSRLIFSCSSLNLEGSTNNGTGEIFKIEWETEDILQIESCWVGKVETAFVNLHLRSKDSREAGITNEKPGFKLLKFAVYDPYWSKAEVAIKLLDKRYTDIWSTFLDFDTVTCGNNSALGRDSLFGRRHYFPIFDEAFDEVIYPKGDPDAVSISKRDVELLQPATFINDTIIDFYIMYLKSKLPADKQERFHFFNSFFFRKLADLDKHPSSAFDGKAAFQRVRKWTRKVNLFEKDYILIPVNYSLHWSLIVICHPGEVTCFRDEEIKESYKVPCILHMDSLKGSHKGLKNVFQSYLCEEWKERNSRMVDDFSSKFLQLRFISLELPQQENLYDCGLFLLHYAEQFLKEAPIRFNHFKITKSSNFLNSNWFPPPEASLKRSYIQNLIYDIVQNNSLQASPADCHGKGPLSESPIVMKNKVEADSPGACRYPAMWNEKPSNFSTEPKTDVRFPTALPIRVASCLREPGFVFKDLQAGVVSSTSNSLHMSACHQIGLMPTIEETEEFGEENAISILGIENSQVGAFASAFPSTPYISIDHGESETTGQEFSINRVEAVKGHSYTGTLEDQLLKKIEESNIPDKTTLEEDTDFVVQDSQESNDGHEIDVCVKSCSSFEENMKSVFPQFFELAEITSPKNDTSVCRKEQLASESNERDTKRPKLMNSAAGPSPSRPLTRRMSKDACLML